MSVSADDVYKLIDGIEQDLRRGLGKLTELRELVGRANLQPKQRMFVCQTVTPAGTCGFTFATQERLDDHRRNVHGEAIPLADEPKGEQ